MEPVETRLLLYTVALGAVVGLVSLVRRRAFAFWFHLIVLAALLCASFALLNWPEYQDRWAGPLFGAFCGLALLPSLLLLAARRLARARRNGWAAPLTGLAGLLLGAPVPIRREGAFYAAMAAADRGDAEACARRLERLAAQQALPPVTGGAALARVLPLAVARRWPAVLDELDRRPAGGTAIRALEARAAAEVGEVGRALAACRALEVSAPHATGMLAQARRAVLACCGRAAFLEEAERKGLPVIARSADLSGLAIARALEAAAEVDAARERYAAVARQGHGRARADAQAALERLSRGEPRRAPELGDHLDEIVDLERACAAEGVVGGPQHRGRARATLWICAITLICTFVQWSLGGPSELGEELVGALAAGALSAPLMVAEGEWWRVATTMLLHVGWVHLLMNVGSILIVGIPMERRVGAARTLVIYLVPGWVASLASALGAGTPLGVGASGGAMGLFGAFFVLLLRQPRTFGFVERARWLRVVWITLLATAGVGLLEHEALDNVAHGVGFAAGALVALGLFGSPDRTLGAARSGVRLAAALLVTAQAVSAGFAAAGAGSWLGLHTLDAAGVSARLASRSFVETTGRGALVRRTPGATLLQLGVEGRHEPDPRWLIGLSSADPLAPRGLEDAFDRGPASQTTTRATLGGTGDEAIVERRIYAFPIVGWERGWFSLVTVRRAGAFALVFVPPERTADELHEPLVQELCRSLRRSSVE